MYYVYILSLSLTHSLAYSLHPVLLPLISILSFSTVDDDDDYYYSYYICCIYIYIPIFTLTGIVFRLYFSY